MRYFNRIIFFLSVTLVLAQPGENGFTIRGTAFYASGEKLENAKAVLIDTTNRVVQQTWTSKKTLKRFGGGSFTFTNVPPGKYLLKITTGTPVDIKRKLKIDKKSLDLGWLRPIKEFPKYAVPEYSDSLLYKMHPIPTKLHSRDSINVKHVLVFLDGNTRITSIDSITGDTLYYTTTDSSVNDTVDLSVLYLAYNDYGRMMYRSRSLEDRWRDLERRGGTLVTVSGDTIQYDRIMFERTMINPQLAIFKGSNPVPEFYPFLEVYSIRTDERYIENSVRKGFWTGVGVIGGFISLRILTEKSLKPVTSILPAPLMKATGNQYQTMIITFPLLTIGWTTYDYIKDKRSNYFIPRYQGRLFPNSMFVFSIKEWIGDKTEPVRKKLKQSWIGKRFKRKKS